MSPVIWSLALFLATVSLAGCKKKVTPVSSAPSSSAPATVVAPGPGGGVVVNAGGGGGSGGAAQAVRGAVQTKAVDANMMKQIHTYIEYASGASGKMPSTQETVAALQMETPTIAALVNDGTIVLNPARSRDDVWAYEKKAYESRGWVATSQGVETMDAATLKSRLGQ